MPRPIEAQARRLRRPETLVFDLYGTLVDPLSITESLANLLGPATALTIAPAWRARQIDYSFRLTMMGRYRDFRWVTTRALHDTLAALALQVSETDEAELVDRYNTLEPHPDTAPGLQMLRHTDYRLAVLSNGAPDMITRCLEHAGLTEFITDTISVDPVAAFKPAAAVYHHAAAELDQPIGTLRLVSANPFDVIGAHHAGMRTAWINRDGNPFDTIAAPPQITATGLGDLASKLGSSALPA